MTPICSSWRFRRDLRICADGPAQLAKCLVCSELGRSIWIPRDFRHPGPLAPFVCSLVEVDVGRYGPKLSSILV